MSYIKQQWLKLEQDRPEAAMLGATKWTVPNNGATAFELADLLGNDGYQQQADIIVARCPDNPKTDLAIVGMIVERSDVARIFAALKLSQSFRGD